MKRTVKDLVGLAGKVVLVRVDFNIPMDDSGKIVDATRINNALPTIKYLVEKKAKVVLLSHLGRPNGFEIHKSLWPVVMILMKKLNCNVDFCSDTIGDKVKERIKYMSEGSVLLLENTRFYKAEEKNDMEFARKISELGDIFVNDAFATSHRKNASTYAVARLMPNAIGLLMEEEIENLSLAFKNPKRPFVAILGGSKVNTKVKILEKFLDKADEIIIGGAMAYTFMNAKGDSVGMSKIDVEGVSIARKILKKAKELGKQIILPIDHVAISQSDRRKAIVKCKELRGDLIGYDIGEETISLYSEEIAKAGQIFWNGPLGLFENPHFQTGTFKIAEAIALSNAFSIVGGGDTVSALNQSGQEYKINFISTGGGATMEFIEKETLPCLEVIQEKIV